MKLLLVDALNLVRRVYAAQPGEDGSERAAGAGLACAQSLRRALAETRPSHAACVFEGAGASWRHELFAGYKEGHEPMPEALAAALGEYRESFAELGVASLAIDRLEADDVIATMAVKAVGAGSAAVVLSTDKVFLQLLPRGVVVRDHFRGRDLDARYVEAKFGVAPEALVDFLALAGDRGNGIPGVTGIGPKTAARLLAERGSLEAVLGAAGGIPGRLGERLASEADTARLCRELVALRTDLELGTNLNRLRLEPQTDSAAAGRRRPPQKGAT